MARREQESEDAAKYVQELSGKPENFRHWDRELLVHLATEAAVHIRRLESESAGLRETVSATEELRRQFNGMSQQYADLQEAHVQQARHARKLEAKVAKVIIIIMINMITAVALCCMRLTHSHSAGFSSAGEII
jgi:hypothetical protein